MPRVTIAAGSRLAAEAGAAVADLGGNAVDAAVAAIIATMCTDPGIVAPGASGFVTVDPASGGAVVIDAYAEMPGREADPDRFGAGERVFLEYGGGLHTYVGYGSVATPGIWAGLEEAWRRYGSIPWRELFEPAVHAVHTGFPLSEAAAAYLAFAHEAIFGWDVESRHVLRHPDGRHYSEGDFVRIPDLEGSLRLLAAEGAAGLYGGELGAAIADAVEAHGGLLGRADLEAYRAVVRHPVRFHLAGWEVDTNPPPAVGGSTMAAISMLADLEGFRSWGAQDVAILARVQRAVLDYRRTRLSEDDDIDVNAARLLEAARVGDLGGIVTSPSTTHTSAADSEGNACAVTVSAGYGSGAMPPSTGFWLNNSLGELELHPAGYHGLTPGTRLISNMAPTTARGRSGVLAIGSAGADRITTALSSVLLNLLVLGMSIGEAVAHPRMHVEVFGGRPTIAHEPGISVDPVDDLDVRRFPEPSMYFGGVQAAITDGAAGLTGVADPRRRGGVASGGR